MRYARQVMSIGGGAITLLTSISNGPRSGASAQRAREMLEQAEQRLRRGRFGLTSTPGRTSGAASRLLVVAQGTRIGPEAGRPERLAPCSNSAET